MKLHALLRLSVFGIGVVAQQLATASPLLAVEESVAIAASPDLVWKAVRNFDDMHWHPAVETTRLSLGRNNEPQAIRKLTLAGGGTITEQLHAHDDQLRTQRYAIIESPLPVDGYEAVLSVSPGDGSDVSVLKWEARFLARDSAGADGAATANSIRDILRAGLDNLKKAMESSR